MEASLRSQPLTRRQNSSVFPVTEALRREAAAAAPTVMGISGSAVPFISSIGTGRDGWQACADASVRFMITLAAAANRSARAQTSVIVIAPPLERPVI